MPVLGSLVCVALIVSRLGSAGTGARAPLIAALLLVFIAGLYFVVRPKYPVPVTE